MVADTRYALRLLPKAPGFAAVVIATLEIAIGANPTIFSRVNNLILRPLVQLRREEVINILSNVAALEFGMADVGDDEFLRRG